MRLAKFIRLRPRIVRAAQRFFDARGFQLSNRIPPVTGIKDADLYQPRLNPWPKFSPWLSAEWQDRLHSDDPRSLVGLHEKYILYCLALDATRRCTGGLCECGVYKGGTAKILAELAPDRPLFLFDTFSGIPDTDPARDLHKAGDFSDTSLESVREYLAGHANAHCIAGLIPQSLEGVKSRAFCFVHVDLDIYSAIKSACEFFYPRMQPGGWLLFDDYGHATCPGARAAVDEFFSNKPEVKMVTPTGQCSIQKL